MSSEVHEIRLIAKDGTAGAFRMVGSNAERMNQQIEKSAQKTKLSMQGISEASRKAGLAIGAMSFASINAFNKSEVSATRLKQTIESTGRSYDEYADAIDRASKKAIKLAFDDEDAADSISKLTQATGDASKAIDDLAIAQDVARARGVSLSDATNLVVAAEQGRIGSLRRMGIAIDDNATSEEALAALRTKYAGQAEAYAQTNAAEWDRARINAENALEAIGSKLASHQTEILAASAAWTAFGGSISSVVSLLGAGGIAGLLGAGGIAGLIGLTAYATSTAGTPGNNAGAALWNTLFGAAAGGFNAVLPGSPFNTEKYSNAMLANTVEEAVKGVFGGSLPNDTAIYSVLKAVGAVGTLPTKTEYVSTVNGAPAVDAHGNPIYGQYGPNATPGQTVLAVNPDTYNTAVSDVQRKAQAAGMTTGQYLAALAQKSGMIYDQTGQNWVTQDELARREASRAYIGKKPISLAAAQVWGNTLNQSANAGNANAVGATSNATDRAAGNYPMASDGMGGVQAAHDAAAAKAAIEQLYGAYAGLADGITTAADAQAAFKATQDGLIGSEAQYSGQISEYSTQLNALDAGYKVLQERQAAGQELSKSDQEFLDGYAAAHERLAGGVDDATVALAKQAEQYAENMRIGDELNKNMTDSTGATGALTSTIEDLILALQGIPGYVKVLIDADTSPVMGAIAMLQAMNPIIYATVQPMYAGTHYVGFTQQHGGLTMAQHGRMASGRDTMVGEAGPEILSLPYGSMVIPSAASRYSKRGKGGDGGGFVINGPITVVANNPRQFTDSLRSASLSGARA